MSATIEQDNKFKAREKLNELWKSLKNYILQTYTGEQKIQLLTLYVDIHECYLINISKEEVNNIRDIMSKSSGNNINFGTYELSVISQICELMTKY